MFLNITGIFRHQKVARLATHQNQGASLDFVQSVCAGGTMRAVTWRKGTTERNDGRGEWGNGQSSVRYQVMIPKFVLM